ncbi:PilZ domain-containing protein [Yunchengibacter salinarum]|uniref:PilZ domain-containing protein n=1 Tax=Yunchengibacter salinarum TaxID=3133399 RepID=UPI0035B624DB
MTDTSGEDSERRQDTRQEVDWIGTLEDEDGRLYDCHVRDVSLAGVLVAADHAFEPGAELLLSIESLGHFAGRVRWQSATEMGLMLLAGPDLMLKKFTERAGAALSHAPDPNPDI